MFTTFFTTLLQQILNIRLLQAIIDGKKKKNQRWVYIRTSNNLKPRICCKKYYKCST